jgi:hypothetical protein
MVDSVKIDNYSDSIQRTKGAYSSDLRIGTIPITDRVSFNLVYRTDNHDIIQGYFEGVNTDLFLDLDGETKSGLNEYDTVVNSIKDHSFQEMLGRLPAELLLSDGKTTARFWNKSE